MVHFPKFSKDFLLKFRMFIHIIPDLQHLTIWLKQFAQKQSMEANCSKLSVLILLTKLTSFHFTDLPAHANVLLIAIRNTWSKSIRFFPFFLFLFYPQFMHIQPICKSLVTTQSSSLSQHHYLQYHHHHQHHHRHYLIYYSDHIADSYAIRIALH